MIRSIWVILKPVLTPILMIIIISVSLLSFGTYQTYQDRKIGASLIKKIKVKTSCNETSNPNKEFSFKFTLTNKNKILVKLEKISVGINLLGMNNRRYAYLLNTLPSTQIENSSDDQFINYKLEKPLIFKGLEKKEIVINLKTASKEEARASPHTFVIYKGKIIFAFDHEMSIETNCQFQVRYP